MRILSPPSGIAIGPLTFMTEIVFLPYQALLSSNSVDKSIYHSIKQIKNFLIYHYVLVGIAT
jgi:hypothetical protein